MYKNNIDHLFTNRQIKINLKEIIKNISNRRSDLVLKLVLIKADLSSGNFIQFFWLRTVKCIKRNVSEKTYRFKLHKSV